MTFGSSGTGMDNSIPEVREQEGNEKKHSQNLGTGRQWKKALPKFGKGKEMKKSIPTFRERESEAIIPGKSQERERKMYRKLKLLEV